VKKIRRDEKHSKLSSNVSSKSTFIYAHGNERVTVRLSGGARKEGKMKNKI
jgi:hypothetical protein